MKLAATVMAALALLVAAAAAWFAWDAGRREWTLFAYPEGSAYGSMVTPGFRSVELCRYAGREAVVAYRAARREKAEAEQTAGFECGRSCLLQPDGQVMACEETVK